MERGNVVLIDVELLEQGREDGSRVEFGARRSLIGRVSFAW